ncbi:hypothetical protein GCM10029978_119850 [Actinoallomurus acanthiterrae]
MDQMYKKLKLTTISELIKNIYCSLSVLIIGCASAYAVEFNKDLIEAEDRENVNLSNLKLMANYP